jgi:hypothetical protein
LSRLYSDTARRSAVSAEAMKHVSVPVVEHRIVVALAHRPHMGERCYRPFKRRRHRRGERFGGGALGIDQRLSLARRTTAPGFAIARRRRAGTR